MKTEVAFIDIKKAYEWRQNVENVVRASADAVEAEKESLSEAEKDNIDTLYMAIAAIAKILGGIVAVLKSLVSKISKDVNDAIAEMEAGIQEAQRELNETNEQSSLAE